MRGRVGSQALRTLLPDPQPPEQEEAGGGEGGGGEGGRDASCLDSHQPAAGAAGGR